MKKIHDFAKGEYLRHYPGGTSHLTMVDWTSQLATHTSFTSCDARGSECDKPSAQHDVSRGRLRVRRRRTGHPEGYTCLWSHMHSIVLRR